MDAAAPWGRLTRRAEFQRAGKGKRVHAEAFTLQAQLRLPQTQARLPQTQARLPQKQARLPQTTEGPRYGLTVTKKTGNSPARSRIKRRLREAMRRIAPLSAEPDFDYVLMARTAALHQSFDALVADIQSALRRAHARKDARV